MEEITLQVETTLPILNSNFEAIKNQLQERLKHYSLIVDEDSIKVAKKMATEINALSNKIDLLRKDKVKELSAPIKSFEEKAKELVSLCQSSRSNLLEQVKFYEDKERERCLELLQSELAFQYNCSKIRAEFQTVKVDDLAIISNLTKGGLAKKATDLIANRVLEVSKFQECIDKRLSTLEDNCLQGGLEVAFTPEHINHFLMVESDEDYQNRLNSLIKSELSRQEASELPNR